MCGGFLEMQSRRAPRLHEEMKQNMGHAETSCCSPLQLQPAAPAGLAIVAALEAEIFQSKGATSRTKASESATSSLPIPISSSSLACDDMNPYHFPAYSNKQSDYIIADDDHPVTKHNIARAAGAQKSIFPTSLSPPSGTHNYIKSCNSYTEIYDDFLGACFFCDCPLEPGKDIYMYRGDRAFCSTECRYKHIVADESLPCTIQINQQCVQASSPSKQPNFNTPPVAIAILV